MNKNIPEDYFDNFADRMAHNIHEMEDDKSMAPTLHNLDHSEPYTVPDVYFQNIPQRLREKISNQSSKNYLKVVLTVIGFLAAVACIGYSYYDNSKVVEDLKNEQIKKIDINTLTPMAEVYEETLEDLWLDDEDLLMDDFTIEYLESEKSIANNDDLLLEIDDQDVDYWIDYLLENVSDSELSEML